MFYLIASAATLIYYQISFSLSITFFIFFWRFSSNQLFMKKSGERGIWTLAPLLTTYSLSRGAPSATWVFLQNACPWQFYKIVVLTHSLVWNGESGIRTHAPLRTNGFQDRLVMTTSISLLKRALLFYQSFLFLSRTFLKFFHRMFWSFLFVTRDIDEF